LENESQITLPKDSKSALEGLRNRLMRLSHKRVVLLFRQHYDAFFALTSNALSPLGSRQEGHLAETGLGALNLPGFSDGFQVSSAGMFWNVYQTLSS